MSFNKKMLRTPLLWDGAMGTELAKVYGIPHDCSVEALNLRAPDAVRMVHHSYVAAGADLLQTNSYQATRVALAPQGLSVDRVNRAAVDHARSVANSAAHTVWVAGSIGPLGEARYQASILSDSEMEDVYREQIDVLVDAGVDLLLTETQGDYRELMAALRAARTIAPDLPIVAQVESTDGLTMGGRIDLGLVVRELEALGVDAIGSNCRVGPDVMQRTARRLLASTDLPISLQPNAGTVAIDYTGRMHTFGDPDNFAEFAQWALDHGVSLIGSCCHSTPRHTAAMRHAIDKAQFNAEVPRPNWALSRLERRLNEGKFVTCVEIDPPTDEEYQRNPGVLQQKIDGARYLEQLYGIDVVTIADHTMGKPWLDPFPFAEAIRPHLQRADLLIHYSCRNKAETDITGNFASFKLYGYHNILVITGDPPANPDDPSFFRFSSVKLLDRINKEHPDSFYLACAFDHTRGMARGEKGIDGEVRRLERKVAAGARLALTQPIFLDRLELLREKTAHLDIPILPGIMPVFSRKHAQTISQFGGIVVPDYVLERMQEAGDDRDAKTNAAIEIAGAVAQRAKELGFPGIYLISSFNRYDVIGGVLQTITDSKVTATPHPVSLSAVP